MVRWEIMPTPNEAPAAKVTPFVDVYRASATVVTSHGEKFCVM